MKDEIFNCLTRVKCNDLDERVQRKFLKGSFLESTMDIFFELRTRRPPTAFAHRLLIFFLAKRQSEVHGTRNYVILLFEF